MIFIHTDTFHTMLYQNEVNKIILIEINFLGNDIICIICLYFQCMTHLVIRVSLGRRLSKTDRPSFKSRLR